MGAKRWIAARLRTWHVVVGVSVLAVVAIGAASAAQPENYVDKFERCREMVAVNLKSPASADFGPGEVVPDGDTATIRGYVDSQNGFGALVRTRYRCTVTGDTVQLVALD